jgi:hypothetical protein
VYLDSGRRDTLYNIFIEFGIMHLNKTCSQDHIGKNLSDAFPVHNGLKQGDALSPLLFNCALEYAIKKV